MPAEPVKYIGDKLVVGPLDYSFIPAVPSIPGSTVLNGPVWIGAGGPQLPIANCMIGPGLHPITLQITGITNVAGVVNRVAIANVSGLTTKVGATLRAALSATTGVNIKSSTNVGSSINTFKTVYVETVLDSPVINCQTLNFTTKIFGADIDEIYKILSSIELIRDTISSDKVDLGIDYKKKYEELVELLEPHKIDDMPPETTLKMILKYNK